MKNLILFNDNNHAIKKYYISFIPKNAKESPLDDMISRLSPEQQKKWKNALIKLENIIKDW